MTSYPFISRQMPAAEYHARPETSNSQLKKLAITPADYKWAKENQLQSTDALEFGHVFHTLLLEPQLLDQQCVEYPDRRAGKVWEAFKAKHAGKTILRSNGDHSMAQARGMADSLLQHPWGRKLFLGQAEREISLFWQDKDTGIPCRGRLDLIKHGKRPVLVDLKTDIDPSPQGFWKKIRNFDYHVQAAFYYDGYFAATGVEPAAFVFGMVRKSAPHLCAFYEVSDALLEAGRQVYKNRLALLKKCQEADSWPGYAAEPVVLETPNYINYFLEDQINGI